MNIKIDSYEINIESDTIKQKYNDEKIQDTKEIKIELMAKNDVNFFKVNDKNKLSKINEELKNTQKNGINKLNETKQLIVK